VRRELRKTTQEIEQIKNKIPSFAALSGPSGAKHKIPPVAWQYGNGATASRIFDSGV